MAGIYDSFFLLEYLEKERSEGSMTHFGGAIKKAVSKISKDVV